MSILMFNKKAKKSSSKIAIFSLSSTNINKICEILQLKGYDDFLTFNNDLLDISPSNLKEDIWAVIVDIDDINKKESYIDNISKIFSNNIIKIILSTSDSIKIQQEFLKHSIFHLNIDYQINEIPNKLSINSDNFKSSFIKIGILGCKGGIGNSLIAYNISKKIYERYLSKTLFIQGANSSFNADFLADVTFEKELINEKGLSIYKEDLENAYIFDKNNFNDFNFLIFDHSIHSLSKESIENILNSLDCVVLVFDFSAVCLRKAKEIYKINDFLVSVNKGCKRLFLCCNNRENSKILLDKASISEIIGKDVDVFIPYKNISSIKMPKKMPRAFNKSLDLLVDKLIGIKKTNKFRLFSRWKRWKNSKTN